MEPTKTWTLPNKEIYELTISSGGSDKVLTIPSEYKEESGSGDVVFAATPTFGTPINKPMEFGNFISIMLLLHIIWFNVVKKGSIQRWFAIFGIILWSISSLFKTFIQFNL